MQKVVVINLNNLGNYFDDPHHLEKSAFTLQQGGWITVHKCSVPNSVNSSLCSPEEQGQGQRDQSWSDYFHQIWSKRSNLSSLCGTKVDQINQMCSLKRMVKYGK